MESQLSNWVFWGTPCTGTPTVFMFKNRVPPSCVFLTKWTDLTKGGLECQWPWWETFEIPNLISSQPNWTKIAQSFPKLSGKLILIGILRLPNIIMDLKLSLCKIRFYDQLRQRWFEEEKVAQKPQAPLWHSLVSLPRPSSWPHCLPPPPSFPSVPPSLLYTLSSLTLLLSSNFSFALKLSPLPLLWTCQKTSFEIKAFEEPKSKPLISYAPWTKAERWAIFKDFPK